MKCFAKSTTCSHKGSVSNMAKARLRFEQAIQHSEVGHSLEETAGALGYKNARSLANLIWEKTGSTKWPPHVG